ncbi:DUF1707 and DUF2154 domain-containing protein [Streptosporangiaceae bacterium NEAU-GS5]|nr:DUF1707 and DUF2154 domain-containing protein [Streptosporangiaceae bacterium NEAU-GS5]
MNDSGEMRASDAEREAVVEVLRQASVEGRLTLAELTERTEAAYLAQTHSELAQLTTDLPNAGSAPRPSPGSVAARPGGSNRQWFVAVMGDTKRNGKWRIDQELGAVAVMGDVTLDLREAEVRGNVIDIVATSIMGDVKIIVPDGVDVELSGVAIMGDKKVKVIEAPPGQNAPIVRVKAFVLMGDVKVIGDSQAQPIRRALFAWSDWWQERRNGMPGYLEAGNAAISHREARRAALDEFRTMRRDAHRAWREMRQEARDARRQGRREWRDGN